MTIDEMAKRVEELEVIVAALVDSVNYLRGDEHLQRNPPEPIKRGPGRPKKVE